MRIVIVGAGHAGGAAAAFLRQFGFTGDIVLVGDEPLAPYQRPPLSKAWLKGEADGEALELRPTSFYAEQGVELRLNEHVTEIDRRLKLVRLTTGEPISYDVLVLATGSSTHKLPVPGGDHPALLELRTAADADKLKARLAPGSRLIIVGAGYVGLEVAASARALGCEAVVVEREPRVLARVASEPLSAFFEAYHRSRGVEILTASSVSAVEAHGRVVRLADGRAVVGDAVLVGIGAAANDLLARNAGLACDAGIVVDLEARTSDQEIYAIGDCTRRPLPTYGVTGRLESVPNALEQAKQAAAAIVGAQAPAAEIPWFWSDQYDVKLQIAGLPHDVDRIVLRGDPAEAKFAVFHLSRDVVQAVEAVNAPPEFMAGRQMISRRMSVEPAALSDTSIPIKSLIR